MSGFADKQTEWNMQGVNNDLLNARPLLPQTELATNRSAYPHFGQNHLSCLAEIQNTEFPAHAAHLSANLQICDPWSSPCEAKRRDNGLSSNRIYDACDYAGFSCFSAGTPIATDKGSIAVEQLSIGDRVLTQDNGYQPLLWIGQKTLDKKTLGRNPNLRPVHVATNTTKGAAPLVVAPQHCVAQKVDGKDCLVKAKYLAHSLQPPIPSSSVSYHHLLFAKHEIVFSEGTASESFYPSPHALLSLDASCRAEVLAIFPDLTKLPAAMVYGSPARPSLRRSDVLRLAPRMTVQRPQAS